MCVGMYNTRACLAVYIGIFHVCQKQKLICLSKHIDYVLLYIHIAKFF